MRFREKNLTSAFARVLLLAVFFVVSQTGFAQSTIVRVSRSGNGSDPTTWAGAYPYLHQSIIDYVESEGGGEIWIAPGEYVVSTLTMKNGVGIYGGFAGIDDAEGKEGRVPGNVTVLYSYPVVFNNTFTEDDPLTNSAVLDSVTVTNKAYNFSPSFGSRGGGMYNHYANPKIVNCTFSGNGADIGGGMYNSFSNPTIIDSTFSENRSYGGGYYIVSGIRYVEGGSGMHNSFSSPTIINCTFSGNEALYSMQYGGAMCNDSSSPIITGCTFSKNSAGYGAGMYNNASTPTITDCEFKENGKSADFGSGGGMQNNASNPRISGCKFSGNIAAQGGGMYNISSSNPIINGCTFNKNLAGNGGGGMYNYGAFPCINYCTFSENQVLSNRDGGSGGDGGGGMYNHWYSNPTITNCTFSGNLAFNGGGMNNFNSNPTITNCTFSGNVASGQGGAMSNWNTSPTISSPTITNCTFSGNRASESGWVQNSVASPTITNCIVWGNTPETQRYVVGSNPQITHSIVQTARGWVEPGVGNKNADPLLMPLGNYGGPVPTMPVRAASPARGAGKGTVTVPPMDETDALGQTRTFPCTIGAVEYNANFVSNSIATKGGKTLFGTGEKFTLEAYAASSSASYQWYKNGILVGTGATYTTNQFESTATYYCVITWDGGSLTTDPLEVTIIRLPTPVGASTFDVYETKVSARTSIIKEMKVKVLHPDFPDDPKKTDTRTIHYRVPVNKSYSIVMAFDKINDVRPDGYTATGYGRMWTAGLKGAYTMGSENLTVSGLNSTSELGGLSPIGTKGLQIPVEIQYEDDGSHRPTVYPDSVAPRLHLTGLATVDWNAERFSGSVGIAYAENLLPLPCATNCKAFGDDQGGGLEDETELGDVYYPRPCLGKDLLGTAFAHFHGTYTTRYNKALSAKAGTTDASMRKAVNDRLPKTW